jgi:hypothetical protein
MVARATAPLRGKGGGAGLSVRADESPNLTHAEREACGGGALLQTPLAELLQDLQSGEFPLRHQQ